jgi:hypothetical protein
MGNEEMLVMAKPSGREAGHRTVLQSHCGAFTRRQDADSTLVATLGAVYASGWLHVHCHKQFCFHGA